MRIMIRFISIIIFQFLLYGEIAWTQVIITPRDSSGIYKTGETAVWTLKQEGGVALDSVRYMLKKGGMEVISQGPVNFENNQARLSYTFETPGTVLLEVRWGPGNNRRNRAVGGAMADPEKFKLSSAKPDDFDEFWKLKIGELQAIPANPVLEKGERGKAGVDYWKITMNNIRGSHIRGQVARPEKGKKFPALLIVQWAGVYPLQKDWILNRAAAGWLVLNIEAHDIPIDEPEEFYREQSDGPLKSYWSIGNDDRENSYFLRMYLSCYRATEYLTERPDWNGKTLVVMGDSQGGLQALMTAGFHPAITTAIALVPAGFDMLGPEVGRRGGWPQWYDQTEGKDPEKVHAASRYFDVTNFVTKIKCPILVGVGLLDETCPPEGILAALNQLSTSKEVIILPRSGHQDSNGSQAAFRDIRDKIWFPALQKGKKPRILQRP